jgi:hypothetical protein
MGLVALAFAQALAQDQGSKDGTDLYDRPVLAIDPGMHTASIQAQAVDAAGRYAVTGSVDRTVRVWSIAEGKLLRTIWIPVGPGNVGDVFAVAISPERRLGERICEKNRGACRPRQGVAASRCLPFGRGWGSRMDEGSRRKVLQDAMDLENVTILTSSKRNELSEELPEWKHGALAEAFLDPLKGAPTTDGIIRLSALTDAMENEIQSLTKGPQHLGMHVSFTGDLFMASHY